MRKTNNMKIGFFQEKPNVWSFTRLASGVIIALGCIIALLEVNYYFYSIMHDKTYEIHTMLIDGLILAGIGGKITQKIFGEKEKPQDNGEQQEEIQS
jgi:hypothetical protein